MPNTKPKQRTYQRVRNFAEYRCVKVAHSFKGNYEFHDEFRDMLDRISEFASGRWTYSDKHFYFEEEQDAVMCRLVSS